MKLDDDSNHSAREGRENRYEAAQKAGLFVLPAICVTGDYAEIALIENLQRQDLTAVEEAEEAAFNQTLLKFEGAIHTRLNPQPSTALA